jgi:hypothetical protein
MKVWYAPTSDLCQIRPKKELDETPLEETKDRKREPQSSKPKRVKQEVAYTLQMSAKVESATINSAI